MGNSAGKFDIVSSLPPELILIILSLLRVKHVLRCLLVCRVWYQIITHLDPYWKERAVRSLGLSWEAAQLALRSFPNSRLFYVATRKHMARVEKSRFEYTKVESPELDAFPFVHCLQARGGFLVHTVRAGDEIDLEQGIVVQKVLWNGPSIVVEKLYYISLGQYSNVAWAHADSHNLLWVMRDGVWGGYSTDQQGDLLSFHTVHPLINDGQGVKISCCAKCHLMVAAYWGRSLAAEETTCTVQMVKLSSCASGNVCGGYREVAKLQTLKVRHNHQVFINRDSRYWLREVVVLSGSDEMVEGVCTSHSLILQCDCCTILQTFRFPEPVLSHTRCIHCDHGFKYRETKTNVKNVSSQLCLSSDGKLLGMVFDNTLVVCRVPVGTERHTKLLSKARLSHRPAQTSGDVQVAAVGHICSLIHYQSETYPMDYRLHIVSNQTGHTLTELRRAEKFYSWKVCCNDPLHRLHLMGHEEDWLSDVQSSVPHTPMVTVHNHHGRVHIESIRTSKSVSQSWRKHWRCAINFTFRH